MKLRVVVATADREDLVWMTGVAGDAIEVVAAATSADLATKAGDARVIVLGERVADADAAVLLDLLDELGAPQPRVCLGSDAPDDRRVAFRIDRRFTAAMIAPLLLSLGWARPAAATRAAHRELDADEARRRERAFAASRRLAAVQDLAAGETAAGAAVRELVACDRAHCLFVDAASGDVWSAQRVAEGDDRRADRGIAGWAARTGGAASARVARQDPRWATSLDDPDGAGDERLVAVPVLGTDRDVHAVLVAVRAAGREPFDDSDVAMLEAYAAYAGPLFEQLAHHVEASSYLEEARGDALFRPEAVEAQAQRRWGDVVRVTPRWIHGAYWALLAALVAAVVYLVVGRVATYAGGPAVIRIASRSEIAARQGGNVTALPVAPGQRVRAGDVIARLDDQGPSADLARLERELEARLRERLLAPTDAARGEAVAQVRLEVERARAALDERTIRASTAGILGDVRVRLGQRVEPGDVVASIVDETSAVEVIALLPGADRPRLEPGQRMRLALTGYSYAYQELLVESVADEALGPAEARRYLGDVAEGAPVTGPVILVRARLPREFVADGVTYRYHDGMVGLVDVEVDSERLIHVLLPGLKKL